MAKEAKTNAMRMLDRQKVKYETLAYECDEFIDGIHCADITGAPYEQSFKTLVMEGKSGGYYVFVVPIEKEVDRKAAAKAVGEKAVDMIHVKDITKITGYVRGGCSPIGMKKPFPTVFDASAGNLCKRGENRPDLESAGSGSSESDRRQTGCNHSRRVRNIYFTENKAKYAKILIKKTLHAAICQMPFSNTLWHSRQCESETNDKVFLIRVR